jgi:uncharacterized protein
MIEASQISHDPARGRFEYRSGGQTAELVYRMRGDRMILLHTGVPEALEGHGVGGQLVTAAVEYAAGEGLTIVAACPFAESWLARHPEVAAQVKTDEFR